MSDPQNQGAGRQLMTLKEVSQRSGISLPTLQRYKKAHAGRIPARGKGRRQRYPAEALAVFEEIRQENLARRGVRGGPKRGRRKQGRPGGARKSRRRRAEPDLLTLTEIGRRTGISYPTLLRYVRLHEERIPHQGKGRARRYLPEAVPVFRQIRSESRRGRRRNEAGERRRGQVLDAALSRRVRDLEKAQAAVETQLKAVIKLLKKPLKVTIRSS